MGWDQAVKDRVCTLWKEGLSGKETAEQMTRAGVPMTRRMVTGIVHRAKAHLEPRQSIPRHTNGGYGPGKSKPKPPPPLAPALPPELQAIVDAGLITLENLHPRMCKFPIGDISTNDLHFCGKAQKQGYPYCPDCCKVAYQPMHHGATISAEDRQMIADMNRKSGAARAFGG